MKLKNMMMAGMLLASGMAATISAQAQDADTNVVTIDVDDDVVLVDRKFYTGSGLDGGIFSTSLFSRTPGGDKELTTLRFSTFFHFDVNFHYDFSNAFGIYTGIGIKNIGFIEKFKATDSTVKRRVYALGIPVGLKFGNMRKRNFVFLGGGADLALNYREKGFVNRGDKDKFNEWFSDRTNLIMPYAFIGASFSPGITLKAQYYPQNFFNTDFTTAAGAKPYANYEANLILLSVGIDIHHNTLPKEIKKKKATGMM